MYLSNQHKISVCIENMASINSHTRELIQTRRHNSLLIAIMSEHRHRTTGRRSRLGELGHNVATILKCLAVAQSLKSLSCLVQHGRHLRLRRWLVRQLATGRHQRIRSLLFFFIITISFCIRNNQTCLQHFKPEIYLCMVKFDKVIIETFININVYELAYLYSIFYQVPSTWSSEKIMHDRETDKSPKTKIIKLIALHARVCLD